MNLIKPEHDDHWSPGEHTGTFRGQDLSFVAGREALAYFDDDALMSDVRRKAEIMWTALETIRDAHAKLEFQVKGRGMIQGLDLGDGATAKQVSARCFELGLLIAPCGTGGRVLKLIPPLTIPDADLADGLAILERAFEDVLSG